MIDWLHDRGCANVDLYSETVYKNEMNKYEKRKKKMKTLTIFKEQNCVVNKDPTHWCFQAKNKWKTVKNIAKVNATWE